MNKETIENRIAIGKYLITFYNAITWKAKLINICNVTNRLTFMHSFYTKWRDTVVFICGSIVDTHRYLNEMVLDETLFGTIEHTIYSHKSKLLLYLKKQVYCQYKQTIKPIVFCWSLRIKSKHKYTFRIGIHKWPCLPMIVFHVIRDWPNGMLSKLVRILNCFYLHLARLAEI